MVCLYVRSTVDTSVALSGLVDILREGRSLRMRPSGGVRARVVVRTGDPALNRPFVVLETGAEAIVVGTTIGRWMATKSLTVRLGP